MILYTPLPLELIWASEGNVPSYQEVEFSGITFVIQPTGPGIGKIVQIRSSDPNVYLRPEYQPGREISLFSLYKCPFSYS
ncbi:MAG: hypothetical protein HPY58_01185 [Firmicutes bacterium]|nr:hypothetical protein [Bacillota bacterium]